jgi:hypothetical protein
MSLRTSMGEYVGGGFRQTLDILQPRALLLGLVRCGWVLSILRGTWVILCLLVRLGRDGLRRATSSTAPAAPAPPARKGPPPKVKISKEDGPPPAGQEGAEEAGEEPPAKSPKAKAGKAAQAAGGWLQNAALTALVLIVASGTLSTVWAVLAYLLRPYATVITWSLVLLWIAAALTADAVTRPVNDHDEDPGEEPIEEDLEDTPDEVDEDPQETEPVDPWPAQRELLRKYVEDRVMTVAANHAENVKGRGARVDDLLAEQQAHGGLVGLDRNAFEELLTKAGITWREQMKFRVLEDCDGSPEWVKKNCHGVHVEDLARDLGRRPRLPSHLVPDITPNPARIPAQESAPIPLPRAVGE